MQAAFSTLVGFTPKDSQSKQITRSTSRGGISLRSSVLHAPAAYLASIIACASLDGWDVTVAEDFTVVLEMVRALTHRPQFGANNEYSNCSQHELSASIDDLQLKGLLDTLPKIDCARLLSCSSGGIASAWLTAVPSRYASTAIAPACFIVALKLYLGAVVCVEDICPCCDKLMDTNGYHATTCKGYYSLSRRHDSLRDIFQRWCSVAQLAPKKEPLIPTKQRDFETQTVYTARTRSDILLLCTGSRPFAVDFAVTSPLQPKFISGAAKETGYAAERYSEEVKEMKYEADFEELDIEFKPIVLETFGAVCRRGLDLICFVARHVANRRNISVSKAVQRINAQLSCSLMRFNALSVIERDQQAILRE